MKNLNLKNSGKGSENFINVSVYNKHSLKFEEIKINSDDVVYIQDIRAKKFLLMDGTFHDNDHSRELVGEGFNYHSLLSLNDFIKVLPDCFKKVSDEYIINKSYVRNYQDGHFYLIKNKIMRVVEGGEIDASPPAIAPLHAIASPPAPSPKERGENARKLNK